jgi:hypothetical protein
MVSRSGFGRKRLHRLNVTILTQNSHGDKVIVAPF